MRNCIGSSNPGADDVTAKQVINAQPLNYLIGDKIKTCALSCRFKKLPDIGRYVFLEFYAR